MESLELDRIYPMDCLEGIKKIPDKSIKLICTDPPYFLGMTHNGKKGEWDDLAICRPFYSQLAQEWVRVLAPDGEFYVFCDWRTYAFYYPIIAEFLPVKNCIVWDKMTGPGTYYDFQHEFIIYGGMGKQRHTDANVWRIKGFAAGAKQTNGEKVHPTQKPLSVIRKILEDGSQPGDTALDCFSGSGTTAVAAVQTGRRYICFEIAEKYWNISQERIKELTKG